MSEPTRTLPGTGSIEVIVGSMYSGKTEELIRRLRRAQIARQRVQVFKPLIDDRYADDEIVSHSALRIPAANVRTAREILEGVEGRTQVVGIDEAHFYDDEIPNVVETLADMGKRVIVAGLDLDYLGVPFEHVTRILAQAEEITKSLAICVRCGVPLRSTPSTCCATRKRGQRSPWRWAAWSRLASL